MTATIEQRLALLERDNAETKLEIATIKGQFEFISGQLRDVQRYMHNRFGQIEATQAEHGATMGRTAVILAEHGSRLDRIEHGLTALRRDLPKLAADAMREVLAERDGRPI